MHIHYDLDSEPPVTRLEPFTALVRVYTPKGTRVIRLRDGDTAVLSWGSRDEEGYNYTQEVFNRWFDQVYRRTYTEACDCDGRLDTSSAANADLFALPFPDSNFPRWQNQVRRQRDYQAEAAGY